MAKKQSTTTPEVSKESNSIIREDNKSPANVQDAWYHAQQIVKGLDSILYTVICSDEGFTPEDRKALSLSLNALIKQMDILEGFIKSGIPGQIEIASKQGAI